MSFKKQELINEIHNFVLTNYEKNGFLFMGNDERKRYEDGKIDTIAMYFDLQNVM